MERPESIAVNSNSIAQMMGMQREILKHYITIEGLPSYPVDWSTKPGQKLIKDFCRRMIEEMGEAYGEIELMFNAVNSNNPKQAQLHLKQFNIELADVMHFFLELALYLGIDAEGFDKLAKDYVTANDKFLMLYRDDKPLRTFLNIADFFNQDGDLRKTICSRADRFIVATEDEKLENFLLCGGRRISERLVEYHAECLWQITYQLSRLMNVLNNREWHATEKMVNTSAVQEEFTRVTLALAIYYDFIGMGEIALVNGYAYKNKENLKRIKDGY